MNSINVNNQVKQPFGPLPQYNFPASSKKAAEVKPIYSREQILSEPPLFSASLNYAYAKGGVITKSILDKMLQLPDVQKVISGELPNHHIIVDSRIHDLKKGDYPAVPGYHTDFVERKPETNMQPDFRYITPTAKVYVVNISDTEGGVSNTEYVAEDVKLDIPTDNIYQKLDEQLRARPNLKTFKANDGDIVEMDQLSLHQATTTHATGSRFFMRFSILHDLTTTILQTAPQNEIRNHWHVYVPLDEAEENQKRLTLGKMASKIETVGPALKAQYTLNEIRNEPILIDADLDFARANCGLITKKFIEAMENNPVVKNVIKKGNVKAININTRVHMLYKGQLPDLSLWRNGAPFEENCDATRKLKAHHFVCLSSTKPDGIANIQVLSQDGKSKTTLPNGSIVHFQDGTLNRALPAHDNGWRLATIMSIYTEATHQNKVTQQLPVYLEDIALGF